MSACYALIFCNMIGHCANFLFTLLMVRSIVATNRYIMTNGCLKRFLEIDKGATVTEILFNLWNLLNKVFWQSSMFISLFSRKLWAILVWGYFGQKWRIFAEKWASAPQGEIREIGNLQGKHVLWFCTYV